MIYLIINDRTDILSTKAFMMKFLYFFNAQFLYFRFCEAFRLANWDFSIVN